MRKICSWVTSLSPPWDPSLGHNAPPDFMFHFMTPCEEYWKENIATLGTKHIHSQACWCLGMGSRSTLPIKHTEVSWAVEELCASWVKKCKEDIWSNDPNEWVATAEKLCLTFPGGLKVASGSSIQTFPFFIAIPGSTNLSNSKHWYLEKCDKIDENNTIIYYILYISI